MSGYCVAAAPKVMETSDPSHVITYKLQVSEALTTAMGHEYVSSNALFKAASTVSLKLVLTSCKVLYHADSCGAPFIMTGFDT